MSLLTASFPVSKVPVSVIYLCSVNVLSSICLCTHKLIEGSKHLSWIYLVQCFLPSVFLLSKGGKPPDIREGGEREVVTL